MTLSEGLLRGNGLYLFQLLSKNTEAMASAPIRILHVVLSLEPGGMENGLVNVASQLDRDEFEVHVCCLERGGGFIERLPQPKNVIVLKKQPGFSVPTVVALAKVIAQIKPDLIHSHNLGPLIYSSLATCMGLSRPILQGEHGFPKSERMQKRLRLRRFFYRACRQVQAVSHGLRESLIEHGMPPEKIIVILNGVNTERFIPGDPQKARAQIGLPVDGPVLGIVGRFDLLKRHSELVEAFTRLSQQFSNAQLLIVGDGGVEWARVNERVSSSKVKDRIHLAGFQSEPRPFYQAMDLLVVPSLVEGLSNVVLEAMACGVPVLAHQACGNAEIIFNGKDGVIADLGSVENLRSQLENVLGNPARLAEMGIAARQNVLERFSMRRMVENYASVYRKIAGRATRPQFTPAQPCG